MEDNLWISELDEIVSTLEKGGIVLYPTDTIWGLGCDAMNAKSIEKIYKIKKRPATSPLVVLVSDIEMLKRYAHSIHPRVETLLSMHRQPLTIVYSDVSDLPDILYSAKHTVAIRVVQDPFCQAVIHRLDRPIVSTSANISGQPWPKGFGEISSEIIKASNYVVRHRREEKVTGSPSVIATFNSKGNLNFIRE